MNNHVIVHRPVDDSYININVKSERDLSHIAIERFVHQFHNCIEIVAIYRDAHNDAVEHCNNIIHIP